MKFDSKTVHSGDRRKAGDFIPATTPIYASSSFFYGSMDQLDRVLGREEDGPSYSRYGNPTTGALEDLVADLENGYGAVACASGMSALHMALIASVIDRPKHVLASSMTYGTTAHLLMSVMEPLGIETTFADFCDFKAVEGAFGEAKFGAVLMETISNPLLRVAPMDQIAAISQASGVPLIVDNTFATPMLVRPLDLGASFSVHSVTKYLGGHGDVLGGIIVTDRENIDAVRTLSRTLGPTMSPFESYLTMRGIKTLALRVERQCANACRVASWLKTHPRVARVCFTGDPEHPDAATIARLFPKNLYGAMVGFEIRDAGRDEVFRCMENLKMIVRGTSLGDVHTMMLYPAISSHRELAPKQRQRLGIHDNFVRLSIGIESADDIIADLEQALTGC